MSNSYAVDPDYEPISLDNPIIPKFLENMGTSQKIIKVLKSEKLLPLGNCYWNVEAMVRSFGGSAVYGWDISYWPGSHIAGMHHAIWKSPSGEMLDVTDSYPTAKIKTYSSFLADDSIKIDLSISPGIPNIYFASPDHATQDFINVCTSLHKLQQQRSRILYDCGYRCEHQFAIANEQPLPNLPNLKIAEVESRTLKLKEEIAEQKIKLGSAIINLRSALLSQS